MSLLHVLTQKGVRTKKKKRKKRRRLLVLSVLKFVKTSMSLVPVRDPGKSCLGSKRQAFLGLYDGGPHPTSGT